MWVADRLLQITNVYQDASFEASALISQAMFELHDCLVPGADCKALASSMNLCDAGPSNATEWVRSILLLV